MAAMVWPLMGRIFKSIMGGLLWIIRILERWLERFDDKTAPWYIIETSLKEDQIPNENRQGSVNAPEEIESHQIVIQFQLPREPEGNPNVTPIPNSLPLCLNRCLFCGMDPPDHVGRHCPQRQCPL